MTECLFLKVLHIAKLFLWSTDNSPDNQSSPPHSMRYASPWSPQSPTAGSNIIDLTVPAKEPEVIDLTHDDDDADDAIQACHGTKREASYDDAYSHFAKRVTRTRVCSTCDEERAVRWYPTTRGLRTHNHSSDNCMMCYQAHIATQLELRDDAHVPCLQCGEMLIHADIEGLVDKEHYLRYDELRLRAEMRQDKDFAYCLECNSGHFHAGGTDYPIFQCPACEFEQCITCNVPWHRGSTCEDYNKRVARAERRRRAQEQAEERRVQAVEAARLATEQAEITKRARDEELSTALVPKISKPCPNCKVAVEKAGGCDHMTCRCGHQYWWPTGAPYTL